MPPLATSETKFLGDLLDGVIFIRPQDHHVCVEVDDTCPICMRTYGILDGDDDDTPPCLPIINKCNHIIGSDCRARHFCKTGDIRCPLCRQTYEYKAVQILPDPTVYGAILRYIANSALYREPERFLLYVRGIIQGDYRHIFRHMLNIVPHDGPKGFKDLFAVWFEQTFSLLLVCLGLTGLAFLSKMTLFTLLIGFRSYDLRFLEWEQETSSFLRLTLVHGVFVGAFVAVVSWLLALWKNITTITHIVALGLCLTSIFIRIGVTMLAMSVYWLTFSLVTALGIQHANSLIKTFLIPTTGIA